MNFDAWLDEASKRAPLLTRDDEQGLARTLEAGRRAADLLAGGSPHPRSVPRLLRLARLERLPTSRRTVDWLHAIEAEGQRARERFIEANLRLVAHVVKRYQRSTFDREDLFAYGVRGLMRAIDKFEWRKEFRFSTYATWWIRQFIERGIAEEEHLIRLPVHAREDLFAIRKTARRLEGELGRDPTEAEMADSMSSPRRGGGAWTAAKVRVSLARRDRVTRVGSLDTPAWREDAPTIGEALPNDEPDPFDAIDARLSVEGVLDVLSSVEREVITMRFGLDGLGAHTLTEIGERLGVSRERARQIQAGALEALREVAEGRQRATKPIVRKAEFRPRKPMPQTTLGPVVGFGGKLVAGDF